MNKQQLRQMLLSCDSQLLITPAAYSNAMVDIFPIARSSIIFEKNPPTYKQTTQEILSTIKAEYRDDDEDSPISFLTSEYDSEDLKEYSIAYHRIFGFITAASRWWFSSQQFERDLLAAEANTAIGCHFLHINSGGGQAWYLDRLSETMRSCKKPMLCLVEHTCGSAAYYIACHAKKIITLTNNDILGCIGTMVHFIDFTEYFEKLGIKDVTIKSSYSDLKNKKYEDITKGKPEQFITDELDPLSVQFINEVRTRPALKDLPDDSPILRGETYLSTLAIENGLADSMGSFLEALNEAIEMSKKYLDAAALSNENFNFFN